VRFFWYKFAVFYIFWVVYTDICYRDLVQLKRAMCLVSGCNLYCHWCFCHSNMDLGLLTCVI